MKKTLIICCCLLMIHSSAQACGGVEIQDTKGKSYCMSKFTMNWYSAYAWCKEQGMDLVRTKHFCSGTDSCGFKISEEMKSYITQNGGGLGYFWTDITIDNSLAKIIHTNGYYETNGALLRRLVSWYAMCQ